MDQEERIAMFLDYENLAISARETLAGHPFDLRPVTDALAERGRVVVRRAYADWSFFGEDRRMLTRAHVELIEIPQRMGASRKNAADIKMVVDALELAFERDYISTFVLGTGDSDFTPLVAKLRELNKRVIGVGIEKTTSALLPPACDEFLYYDRLEGVAQPAPEVETPAREVEALPALVAQSVSGTITASRLKRTLLRKDPTFNEADYGFRSFGELLRHLAGDGVVELSGGSDPEVSLPEHGDREAAFALLRGVVEGLAGPDGSVALSGLKNQVRKAEPGFTEKKLGYRSFLQFVRAADTSGAVGLRWSPEAEDYLLTIGAPKMA
ncbi:NYN domain-containing protein [Actinoplanes sp. CA-131856]